MTDTGFDVSVVRLTGTTVLCVCGEVDVATVPGLRAAIAEAMRPRPRVLVIDLLAVTFLASCGLLALAEAAAERAEVRVVAASRECVRPIRVTGLDAVLSMYGTLADALS